MAAAGPVDPLPPPAEGVPLNASPVPVVSTLAGSIVVPSTSVDGVGAAARFKFLNYIAVAPSGVAYVTEYAKIRKIDLDGTVTTVAGTGVMGFADGVGAAAQFSGPAGIAIAPSGVLYVADTYNHRIRQIDPATGTVTTLAGSGQLGKADGIGPAAQFRYPKGVAVAPSGVLYVADENRIRQIDPVTGTVTTLAGSGVFAYADGPAAAAHFTSLDGIAVAPSGIVYVSERNRIRQINPITREVTTLADPVGADTRLNNPTGIAVAPSGLLYVADRGNHRIRQIDPATGAVTTLAGSGVRGFADGPGPTALFKTPTGVALSPSGDLYVAELYNDTIRKIKLPANLGFKHFARKAVLNSRSRFGALPESLVGSIFSYLGDSGAVPQMKNKFNPGVGGRSLRRRKTRANKSRRNSRR